MATVSSQAVAATSSVSPSSGRLHAASLINVLDPQALIYGGGVIEGLGHWMIEKIATTAREHAINRTGIDKVKIDEAALGEHAGVVGAALMAADLLLAPAPLTAPAGPVSKPAPKRRKPTPRAVAAKRPGRPPKAAPTASRSGVKPTPGTTARKPGRPPKAR